MSKRIKLKSCTKGFYSSKIMVAKYCETFIQQLLWGYRLEAVNIRVMNQERS